MRAGRIDHLVHTVADIERSVGFYSRVTDMQRIEFGAGRIALAFGRQKINLHRPGEEFEAHAGRVQAGTADPCFVIEEPIAGTIEYLRGAAVEAIDRPLPRSGAQGEIVSVYSRDPDGKLIEVCNYLPDSRSWLTCSTYSG